jgi:protein-disulfide isomerase
MKEEFMKRIFMITVIMFFAAVKTPFAQQLFSNGNFADSLSVSQLKKLNSLTKNIFLSCGHKEPLESRQHLETCGGAKRIYNFAAHLLKKQVPEREIIEEIKLRNAAFFDTVIYETAAPYIRISGDENSPVEITAFINADCPSCKQVLIPLYELSEGFLKGKFKVSMKPLYRQLGDIALVAANQQNKSWELLRAYLSATDGVNADNIDRFFSEAQIDKSRIYKEMGDTNKIYSILAENYSEAKRCKMTYTPHLLFNGIIYESDTNLRWIIDFIEWKLEKIKRGI